MLLDIGLIALTLPVALGLSCWLCFAFRRARSRRIRLLLATNLTVCLLLAAGNVFRLLVLLVRAGYVDESLNDVLFGPTQTVLSLLVIAVLSGIFYLLVRVYGKVDEGEELVETMTARLPLGATVDDYGLSPREREVVETMRAGALGDRELAALLFISPATANTHVRNVLRKTGLRSRHDLVLLASRSKREGSSPVQREQPEAPS